MTLSKKQIEQEVDAGRLVLEMIDPAIQIQPAGVDLTVLSIEAFNGAGHIDFSNKRRTLATLRPVPQRLEYDTDGEWETYELGPGAYSVMFNERIEIPLNMIVMLQTRSSLLRNGASVHAGYGDPGFHGKYRCLLVVHNEDGIDIEKGARVAQIVFFGVMPGATPYDGIYNEAD